MPDSKKQNSKRTQIEEVGRINLINELLSSTGLPFSNCPSIDTEGDFHIFSSHRLLLEGIDFNLVYNPLKHLGYKSVLSVLGPLAAKNCTPVNLSVNLGLSNRFCAEDAWEFWAGVSVALKEFGISFVSLDIQSSLTGMAISLSSQGKQPKEIFVQTPQPVSGDLICISGNLGAAYMGLQLLERERALFEKGSGEQPRLKGYEYILKSYLAPELDLSFVKLFSGHQIFPSAGIFINDGLAASVKRLCMETSLGANIYLEKVPVATETFAIADEFNMEATTAVLNGGDDFRLMYTIPISKYEILIKEIPGLEIIGHLTARDNGTWIITPDGSRIALKAQGWSE
ncbi:MAG: AIR synthase related protein [Bacteroidales bacterium]|nr:AIR synthase related protein [Bacteroidales bacterium]MDD2425780.1 AIR synthase related protein [Bacteroidales bacterium]MDD3990108.1 AIR synthase related protein [Bacteroidales bacterium]MDD4638701.1 AIR synthase related protein [Bacteroidales bacterium]